MSGFLKLIMILPMVNTYDGGCYEHISPAEAERYLRTRSYA